MTKTRKQPPPLVRHRQNEVQTMTLSLGSAPGSVQTVHTSVTRQRTQRAQALRTGRGRVTVPYCRRTRHIW